MSRETDIFYDKGVVGHHREKKGESGKKEVINHPHVSLLKGLLFLYILQSRLYGHEANNLRLIRNLAAITAAAGRRLVIARAASRWASAHVSHSQGFPVSPEFDTGE